MQPGMLAFLAFSPILLAAVLLVGLRWPAKRAMPVVYILTAGIGLYVWEMSLNRVLASTLQGLVITVGVLWISFGAILLLNTLKYSGGITAIRAGGRSPRESGSRPSLVRSTTDSCASARAS